MKKVQFMDNHLYVEKNMAKYIDAKFSMLYICTYEEKKVDRYILAAAGRR